MPETFEILLDDFAFPKTLPNSKANFRVVVDIRYVAKDGGYETQHVILPGLDTYWECDREKKDDPNYVRGADEGAFSRIDMRRLDPWDRLVLLVHARAIYGIQVKAFDVNREDVWNRLKDIVGQMIESVLGGARGMLKQASGPVPALTSDAFGSAADDLVSHVLKRLGNGDRILFRGSATGGTGVREITGRGTSGEYRVALRIVELGESATRSILGNSAAEESRERAGVRAQRSRTPRKRTSRP